MGIKRWKLPVHSEDEIDRLSHKSGLPWVLCAVLSARGFDDPSGIQAFISDDMAIEDPFIMADMQKAASRVSAAMENGERIAVYGDYDCDGLTATALLVSYLQSTGADVIYYIPSREKEGYGLNNQAIGMLKEQKTDVIITVDNGVSAHDEVEFAKSLGIDVVITDHHTPRGTLPRAVAVVNPHRHDCKSAFKDLAGVGVAFKFICALENAHPLELLEYYSEIVALGTIADVVPLLGENRSIVKHGLKRLSESGRPGIDALIEVSGLKDREFTCESASYGIIPRINAAGRMGVADDIVELLLTDDMKYAKEIAAEINEKNNMRKKVEEEIMIEIDGILRKNKEILTKRVIVVSGECWHHGVVGIVAAKIMEKYGKPCILLSVDGDTARGSGRSFEGFSLIQAITACSGLLTRFGGHTLAAGLTLPASSVGAFESEIQEYARLNHRVMPVYAINVSCVLPVKRFAIRDLSQLSLLEPFGAANEAPVFMMQKLTIEGIYPTADKKHIRIKFYNGEAYFYAVYFRMCAEDFPYVEGAVVDIAAGVSVEEFNGKLQISVKIRDIRPFGVSQDAILDGDNIYFMHLRREYGDIEEPSRLFPDRADLAAVYRHLKKSGGHRHGTAPLYYQIMGGGIDYLRMLIALDVMEELNLIEYSKEDGVISLKPDPPKVDINHSSILSDLTAEFEAKVSGNG